MEKKTNVTKEQLEIIRGIEDMIHDITGAPEEELTKLGVNRDCMLSAANDVLLRVKGQV